MAIKGIDVSVWQGAIDFNAVRNSGVDFVIIRAGYGTNSKDKYFEENYSKKSPTKTVSDAVEAKAGKS